MSDKIDIKSFVNQIQENLDHETIYTLNLFEIITFNLSGINSNDNYKTAADKFMFSRLCLSDIFERNNEKWCKLPNVHDIHDIMFRASNDISKNIDNKIYKNHSEIFKDFEFNVQSRVSNKLNNESNKNLNSKPDNIISFESN